MSFNIYSMYSYTVQDLQTTSDTRVVSDLQRLGSIEEYDIALQSVLRDFGEIQLGEEKQLDFPDEIKVLVKREENMIIVGAIQNEKQIFGKYWARKTNE